MQYIFNIYGPPKHYIDIISSNQYYTIYNIFISIIYKHVSAPKYFELKL